jgi:hypothetical protein
MPPDMRSSNPHFLVLGRKGSGKTDLMARMLVHDIRSSNRAVVAVDTDGALVESVQRWVASQVDAEQLGSRIRVIDPASDFCDITYNPFAGPDDDDLQSASSSIVAALKSLGGEPPGSPGQWNQQSANIHRNAAMLLIAN